MFHLGQPSRQWPRICLLVEDVYDVSDLTLSGFGKPPRDSRRVLPGMNILTPFLFVPTRPAAVEGCSPDRQLPSRCDRSVGGAARVPRGGRQAQGLKARFPAVGRGAAAETRGVVCVPSGRPAAEVHKWCRGPDRKQVRRGDPGMVLCSAFPGASIALIW